MANPRMTAEIGRVLGGRYRLVAPIGMGASAQVYLADDVKLRRRVAVKMLHDALAGDAEFLRRFRAEARAAAALSHPNVMAVYDWSDGSDEGEVAFIVTEYLSGGSLRALLDSGGLLSPSQALGVGLEAARALDYAHRRGFVHRDIKPANLLFGEEQRLRIADFGLARALAEAAWTEPQGAVLGTARYASPEQAKGDNLSGKADVYSLALVLVEAVTGEVPFVADTTLGTLMARVDRPLAVPDELGPLQSIIAQAGLPDPEQRIDARTLAKGLLKAAHELSRPAPLPLAGALAAGTVAGVDLDPTIHAPGPMGAAAAAPANDLTAEDLELEPPAWVNQAEPIDLAAVAAVPLLVPDAAPGVEAAAGPPADVESALPADWSEPDDLAVEADPIVDDTVVDPGFASVAAPAPPSLQPEPTTDQVTAVATDGQAPDEPRRRRRWPWVALILLVVLAVAGGAFAYVNSQDDTGGSDLVLPVPDLVGRTEAQARAVAQGAGWKVEVERIRKDGTKKGEVLATDPEVGVPLADGQTLSLTVSEGQTFATVPTDLAGMTYEQATEALAAVGLEPLKADTPYDEEVAKDVVIGVVEGTATELEKGTKVPLVVSNGPEPRTVPSGLVGGTQEAATEALESLGLEVAIVGTFSDSIPKGQVISVLPSAGATVERGSVVSVEVSKGPELVSVPNVLGAGSIGEASAIIRAEGLVPSVAGVADGSIQSQSPSAGTLVAPGSTVTITLG